MKPVIGLRGAVSSLLAAAIAACAHTTPAAAPVLRYAPVPTPAPKEARCTERSPARCTGPSPSFTRDVAPVLERRCLSCHANGGVAADEHDFSKLATLRAQKNAVVAEVSACTMPPSRATPLEPGEADVLLRWIACGAPQN